MNLKDLLDNNLKVIGMQQLQKQLGRPLKTKDVASFLGLDVKTVRQYYKELGGIRLGRRYVFFEKEVINAIQKKRQVGSSGKKKWQEEREDVSNKKGGHQLGKRNAEKSIQRLSEKHDLFS